MSFQFHSWKQQRVRLNQTVITYIVLYTLPKHTYCSMHHIYYSCFFNNNKMHFPFILIVLLAYTVLQSHRHRVAHDQVLYKYKATVCTQHSTRLRAREDNKAQVFYQTSLSSELHSFELSARHVSYFSDILYRRKLQ